MSALRLPHLLARHAWRAAKFPPEQGGEVITVTKPTLIGDVRDAHLAVAQQVPRLQ